MHMYIIIAEELLTAGIAKMAGSIVLRGNKTTARIWLASGGIQKKMAFDNI